MFVRTTSYKLKPEYDNPDGLAKIQKEMANKFRNLPGLKNIMQMGVKDGGRYMIIAIYEDEASADAAFELVRKEWEVYEHMMAEPIRIEQYTNAFSNIF